MADSLIFPIGFDLDGAITKAQGDWPSVQRKMETMLSSKPLRIPIEIEPSAEILDKKGKLIAASGSIKAMRIEMASLVKAWEELSQAERLTTDETGKFTGRAGEIVSRFAELTAASRTYAQTLYELQRAADKAVSEQEKALRRQQAEEDKRLNALRAEETSIDALTSKLKVYQQAVKGQTIGSNDWYASALQVRRLSEELQKVNQIMKDFQSKSFRGLSDAFATDKVKELTEYRNRLNELDKKFNELYQNKRAYDSSGKLTTESNDILKQRKQILEEISKLQFTASDAQKKRELEINRIIEQRKAKEDAIASKRKAQQAAIQSNIARLKEERRILNQQESTIAAITAKLKIQQERLKNTKLGSEEFTKVAKEVGRLTDKLNEAKRKTDELTGRIRVGSDMQVKSNEEAVNSIRKSTTYIERLIKRMAVYYSIGQVNNFLTSVREVTAQFELQRISLGAILQNQENANALFSKIKTFALTSPVKILDLTKYTKQLAAYKIGYDELFDTTKRLTDVSVGLGVAMDRVILAYGQVRATGYLRASEIRQFTEMGVPIVEELSKKLTQMNGELVSTADVMDMVSKRGISFELVKDVFNDLTSAGGIFYNVQEKQGNTLYGMWAKLGDAASVMYDKIGNTEGVNNGMRSLIENLTTLMRNWEAVAKTLTTVGSVAGVALLYMKTKSTGEAIYNNQVLAATKARTKARIELSWAQQNGTRKEIEAASAALDTADANLAAAKAEQQRATTTSKLGLGIKSIAKSAGMFIGITAVISLFTYLVYKIAEARQNAKRLKEELKGIYDETGSKADALVTNFESLAKKAVNAADGSREQSEALHELQRTYRDIIPEQNLTIEKLREMKGEYSNLTVAIREYIRQTQMQRGIDTINSEYGKKLLDAERKMKDKLMDMGISEDQASRISSEFKRLVREGEDYRKAMKDVFTTEGLDNFIKRFNIVLGEIKAGNFAKLLNKEQQDIEDFTKTMESTYPSLGKFTTYFEEAQKSISNYTFKSAEQTFARDIETAKVSMEKYIEAFKKSLKVAGVKINLDDYITIGFNGIPNIDFSALDFDMLFKTFDSQYRVPLQNLSNRIKGIYEGFVPPSKTVQTMNRTFQNLAGQTEVNMDNMRYYLMKGGETWEDYSKRIREAMKKVKDTIDEMRTMNAMMAGTFSEADFAELEKKLKFFELLEKYFKPEESKKKNGTKTDERLQILNEMVNTLKNINKEYEDLKKKEGDTAALEDMQRIYADTFREIQSLNSKYKFKLPRFNVPTDAKTLKTYLESISKAMTKLPKSSKNVLSLNVDINKIDLDEKQKEIEKQLKELADRISKTKTARDFYNKILSETGDIELATSVSVSLFGNFGEDLFNQVVQQIKDIFKSGDEAFNMSLEFELDSAIDYENERINYEKLAEIYNNYKDEIIEKNRSTAENIIKEGQKVAAENVLSFEKELAKAKEYEQQRTDVIKREAQRRAEIIKSYAYTPEQKEEKLKLSRKKEQEDLSKINFEEFTKSEDYIRVFQDLADTSRKSLIRLREELLKFIKTNKEISPENMKTLAKALNDIENQMSSRGIGNEFVEGVKGFFKSIKKIRSAKQALKGEQTAYEESLPSLDADIEYAKQQQLDAQQKLNDLKDSEYATDQDIVTAQLRLNQATVGVAEAEEKKSKAAKKVKEAEQDVANEQDAQRKSVNKIFKGLKSTADSADELANLLGDVKDILGVSEDSAAGLVFDSAINGLQTMSKLIGVIIAAQIVFNAVAAANPWMLIATAIAAAISALNFISANKVRKANKEIERQQELIDELEYSYSRLEKLVEKSFGTEYIRNYNLQIKNLEAQREAELKKAEAEKSKGKKEDEDKTKEYLDNARDAQDKLLELQEEFVSSIVGTDVASAAKDFAEEWLDAYLSFDNTTKAIEEKFNEMIQNLVVNQALAGVVQRVLQPFYDEIDKLAKDGEITTEDITKVMSAVPKYVQTATEGLNVAMESLRAAGFDVDALRENTSDLKGISRDIATASEESINGLATGINTQNFYISQIHENVLMIAKIMAQDAGLATKETGNVMQDLITIQNQHLSSLPLIEYNTAETVKRCERAAIACENIYNVLGKVVKPSGTKASYHVSTTIN